MFQYILSQYMLPRLSKNKGARFLVPQPAKQKVSLFIPIDGLFLNAIFVDSSLKVSTGMLGTQAEVPEWGRT